MDLEVNRVAVSRENARQIRKRNTVDAQAVKLQEREKEREAAFQKEVDRRNISKQKTEQYLKEILRITSVFDRELRFSVNKELNQVVVKVIDSHTDKVIKEIPPEDIIRLHSRMKEVIGLLFDKEI